MFLKTAVRALLLPFGLSILVHILAAPSLVANPGFLDASFGDNGKATVFFDLGGILIDYGRAAIVQPDGKILIVGSAEVLNPNRDFAVTRLLDDGSPDPTFGTDGKVIVTFDRLAGGEDFGTGIALQADGKIIVVGSVEAGIGGDTDFGIARLLVDGSLDPTFGTGGLKTIAFDLGSDLADRAQDVAIQADGKIVVAGSARVTGSFGDDFAIARLTSTGALDPSFNNDGKATIAFDLGGNNADSGEALVLQANGKIVMVGSAATATGGDFAVARFNTNGSLDTTFSSDGKATVGFGGSSDRANDVALDTSGRIVGAGSSIGPGTSEFSAFRLTSSGVLDTTFSTDGMVQVTWPFVGRSHSASGVAIDANGGILLGGTVHIDAINNYDFAAVRLLANGDLDPGFGSGGRRVIPFDLGSTNSDFSSGLVLDLEGRVLLVGETARLTQGDRDFALVRLTNNAGCIFADGFESGNTNAWLTQP